VYSNEFTCAAVLVVQKSKMLIPMAHSSTYVSLQSSLPTAAGSFMNVVVIKWNRHIELQQTSFGVVQEARGAWVDE
jgi:hypothetical protein